VSLVNHRGLPAGGRAGGGGRFLDVHASGARSDEYWVMRPSFWPWKPSSGRLFGSRGAP
jgi:hypothetical protein